MSLEEKLKLVQNYCVAYLHFQLLWRTLGARLLGSRLFLTSAGCAELLAMMVASFLQTLPVEGPCSRWDPRSYSQSSEP